MRMPSGVVKRTDTPGTRATASRIADSRSSSDRLRSAFRTTRTSDTVCGIGSSVRSARPVRRTTSSTSGNVAQDVLHAVVQPVDLGQRGLGRQERLQEERALVEPRA